MNSPGLPPGLGARSRPADRPRTRLRPPSKWGRTLPQFAENSFLKGCSGCPRDRCFQPPLPQTRMAGDGLVEILACELFFQHVPSLDEDVQRDVELVWVQVRQPQRELQNVRFAHDGERAN